MKSHDTQKELVQFGGVNLVRFLTTLKEKQAEYHGNQYGGLSQKSAEVQNSKIDTQKELNQFGRRNLSAYDRSILALKLKPMVAARAKERQIRKPHNFVPQKSAEQKPTETRDELAKIAGVSHDTIAKVALIENRATPRSEATNPRRYEVDKCLHRLWSFL